METVWTKRFRDSFADCVEKEFIIREIAELQKHVSNRVINTRKAKSVAGSASANCKKYGVTLMQWDINAEARLLYGFDEELLLIDFSASLRHDCLSNFNRLTSGQQGALVGDSEPLSEFLEEEISRVDQTKLSLKSLTTIQSSGDRYLYPEERTREWLTYLDREQKAVSDAITTSILNEGDYRMLLILGGAGTGKTMILRDVAHRVRLTSGHFCELRVPSGVKEFLQSEGAEVPGLPPVPSPMQAILCDDPITLDKAQEAINAAKELGVPVVIAIDPIQWHQRLSVQKFAKLIETEKPLQFRLSVNYRQGKKVGQPAIDAIRDFRARTSEFKDRFQEQINKSKGADFERISLTSIKFAEDAGTYAFYSAEEFSPMNFLSELRRVGRFKTERKWPKLLIGTDNKNSYPFSIPTLIDLYQQEIDSSLRFKQRAFSQFEEIRGTEFESVFIFIKRSLWRKIVEGVEGAKDKEWSELNAPLTFLTRAENRCVVFELPDETTSVPIENASSQRIENRMRPVFDTWLDSITAS